ncbi:hypothetical protein H6F38_24990 [Paenibacillus sp. EKM208P]|nr:hypothetical protein H6F38_24990 [Paenibacillus sp. EKM208P]
MSWPFDEAIAEFGGALVLRSLPIVGFALFMHGICLAGIRWGNRFILGSTTT